MWVAGGHDIEKGKTFKATHMVRVGLSQTYRNFVIKLDSSHGTGAVRFYLYIKCVLATSIRQSHPLWELCISFEIRKKKVATIIQLIKESNYKNEDGEEEGDRRDKEK